MSDYMEAERMGREEGECWRYFKECPQSLFQTTTRDKYRLVAGSSLVAVCLSLPVSISMIAY